MVRSSRGAAAVLALLLCAPAAAEDLLVAGYPVGPGETRRIAFETSESFAGVGVVAPVLVVRGMEPGPVLCLTGGIHGDELNGIEIVRRLSDTLTPDDLSGSLVAVPIVNPHGFRRSSRYLPDRRDLNRFFPGRPEGSAASRIAYRVFEEVIRRCDYLVDFHTGSFHRTNLPHLRADLANNGVRKLAEGFAPDILLHSVPREGILRFAAVQAGIPTVTFEAGEPMRFDPEAIQAGIEGVERVMQSLGMTDAEESETVKETRVYRQAIWVRVDDGGILLPAVPLGAHIEVGTLLGTVTDPISNQQATVTSPYPGRVIGMARGQVVIPGFAAFRVAFEQEELLPPVSAGAEDEGGLGNERDVENGGVPDEDIDGERSEELDGDD